MEGNKNITSELNQIDAMLDLIVDTQRFYGEEYNRKLKALQEEYSHNIRTTNRAVVENHKKRNELLGKKNYVVRCEFYNTKGQYCDVDAFWTATEEPQHTQRVLLYDNVLHNRGKYQGYIKAIYEAPEYKVDYTTIAVPYNRQSFWSTEYGREQI